MFWIWEFNPATLIAVITALVGLVAGWMTMKSAADETKADARRANERIDVLNAAFSAYRETQAGTIVTQEAFSRLRDELFDRFDKLTERMDRALGRRPPG